MLNGSAGAITVTIVAVADEYGRTVDESVVLAAGDYGAAGPFKPGPWNSEVGKMYVDISDDTSLTFAVLRYSKDG